MDLEIITDKQRAAFQKLDKDAQREYARKLMKTIEGPRNTDEDLRMYLNALKRKPIRSLQDLKDRAKAVEGNRVTDEDLK